MTTVKLCCTGAMARATVNGPLTHGMVGVPVEVEWDAAWEGLLKTLKFRCAEVCRTAVVSEDGTAMIPYECLLAGQWLVIGMDGWDADGTLRIPSSWASCGVVKPSVAQCDGPEGAPPTVDTVSQLQMLVGKAETAAGELAGAADAAASSASDADKSAKAAQEALNKTTEIAVKTPYIGANGNWIVWDAVHDSYVDSGVRAVGNDANVTADNINKALGFTPADVETVNQVKDDLTQLDDVVYGIHKQRTETIVTVETESYTSYYFTNPIPAGSTIKTFNVTSSRIYLVKEDGSLNIDFTLPLTTTEPYIGISTRGAVTAVVEYELDIEEQNGIVDELNEMFPKIKAVENVSDIVKGLEIYEEIDIETTSGFYAYDLSYRDHSSYISTVIDVEKDEKYKLTFATPSASGICGCIFSDGTKIISTPIMSSDVQEEYVDKEVTVPSGATKMHITSLARVSDIVVKKLTKYLTSDILNLHPLKGKTIVNFGDSIFGNKRPPYDVSTALANITGATVYNCGFGGCRMSSHNENWDAFSMYRIAYAVANNDFSLQDAVDTSTVDGMPSYFIETRELLKSINWNDVDIVTIAYGTNDFTASVNLDSEANLYDTTTFAGALRYSIEKLLGVYPHLKIFVCGQTYRFWMDSSNVFTEDSDTRTNSNGVKLTDFVQKTKDVSNEYHLKFIDNYYDLGINKYNRSHWFPNNDGTHHNPLGGKLMAEHMANEMF